jgi:hypothetical protein
LPELGFRKNDEGWGAIFNRARKKRGAQAIAIGAEIHES